MKKVMFLFSLISSFVFAEDNSNDKFYYDQLYFFLNTHETCRDGDKNITTPEQLEAVKKLEIHNLSTASYDGLPTIPEYINKLVELIVCQEGVIGYLLLFFKAGNDLDHYLWVFFDEFLVDVIFIE